MRKGSKRVATVLALIGLTVLPVLADDKPDHWEYQDRRGYSPPHISAEAARKSVEASRATWHVGELRQQREAEGLELKASIYNDVGCVTRLGVDPQSGDILPRAMEAYGKEITFSEAEIIRRVEAILPQIEVGDRAWLGGHGRYWRIPLFLNGTLVSTVKVDAQSGHLLVDRFRHADDD